MNRHSLDREAERAGQDIPRFVSGAQPPPDIRTRIGPSPEPESAWATRRRRSSRFLTRLVFVDGDEEVRAKDLLAIRRAYATLLDRHPRRHSRRGGPPVAPPADPAGRADPLLWS